MDNQCLNNRGSDNRGLDNRGSDNRGSDNQSSDNRGSDNQGSDNQGSDNRGSDNRGLDNQALDNRGWTRVLISKKCLMQYLPSFVECPKVYCGMQFCVQDEAVNVTDSNTQRTNVRFLPGTVTCVSLCYVQHV